MEQSCARRNNYIKHKRQCFITSADNKKQVENARGESDESYYIKTSRDELKCDEILSNDMYTVFPIELKRKSK